MLWVAVYGVHFINTDGEEYGYQLRILLIEKTASWESAPLSEDSLADVT